MNFTPLQILVPFTTVDYRPFWVGLGQVGFYVWALVNLSFYIRPTIGQKTWRLLHYLSFGMYLLGLFHGIFSGTDSTTGWAQQYYWFSGASLLFLFFVRLLTALFDRLLPKDKRSTIIARPGQG